MGTPAIEPMSLSTLLVNAEQQQQEPDGLQEWHLEKMLGRVELQQTTLQMKYHYGEPAPEPSKKRRQQLANDSEMDRSKNKSRKERTCRLCHGEQCDRRWRPWKCPKYKPYICFLAFFFAIRTHGAQVTT
jgi:hypothetical protein